MSGDISIIVIMHLPCWESRKEGKSWSWHIKILFSIPSTWFFHICSIFSYFSDSTICCMCVSCFCSLGIPLTSRLAQDRVWPSLRSHKSFSDDLSWFQIPIRVPGSWSKSVVGRDTRHYGHILTDHLTKSWRKVDRHSGHTLTDHLEECKDLCYRSQVSAD